MGGNKGPAEQSYFRAPPPVFNPFLYIDTKYSSVWWSLRLQILDCSESGVFFGGGFKGS
jgi:hypothetical protein